MRLLAQVKRLQLNCHIAPDLPPALSGDPNRLYQILANLVDNALKFTEQGSVEVTLYCPNETHWAMQVSDTGPGIPVEAHSYIFEAFQQVDGTATRVHGGTGLGLAIVRQLTNLMDGEILLESKPGEGSTFTILLPL
jgi:signal transduction histidine kinase